MKAMLCRAWGAPDVLRLEDVPPPALRSGEVRIRVRASGVNFADSLMVSGTYQVKPPFPFTPGLEAAGEVMETGSGVTGLRTGQRVIAVLRNGGSYAEEIVLDAATVVPIPETMDFVTAAAFPVAYGTSHFALTHRGRLQSGETLLVLGAAGGVGLTAVEIGKVLGARVIAAAGDADKLAVAQSRGADELIDYRSESIRDRVRELTRRGHRFSRYADDCNIYVRSRRAGERGMASMSRFLTNKLRLKVNEAKSAVARPEERKFLGFSISNDGSERRIAPKALDKFKTQVRDKTRRTRGISLPQLIEDLTPYLIGWRGYFGFCQTPRVLTNLEAWIRRRLRSYLWRQWHNGHNRFTDLRRRGVPKFHAAVAAGSPTGFWRMSGHPAVQQALRNHYFDSLGLPRLYLSAQA